MRAAPWSNVNLLCFPFGKRVAARNAASMAAMGWGRRLSSPTEGVSGSSMVQRESPLFSLRQKSSSEECGKRGSHGLGPASFFSDRGRQW
nr:hypothetical protein Itr_chr06CG16460 [Ipomoea trifida]